MKKIIRVMAIFLILLSLAACSNSEVPTTEEVEEVPAAEEEVKEVSTAQEATIVPTDEEVKLAYEKAREAYSWFDLTTMYSDGSSQTEYNGNIYVKVNQEGFESLSDLESYLHTLFSDDIVDSLLATNRYIDIDGALYALPADRGTNIFAGEEHHKIIRESDKKIIYEVTVDILDENFEKVVDEEVYSFAYELIGDKWVFTNFSLVR
ncbi:MAG TPA: hypothetical protein GX498_03720 [Clostridiales bacterium]|nr:hypothetical protein [Clostridiales bacterium]